MLEDPYAYVVAAFLAPPSPDYVSGPKHPPLLVYVPEFVPELRMSHPMVTRMMILILRRMEEEDEYLSPADSTAVTLPAVDHAPSAEQTESFETDESAATPPPHPAYRITARILGEPVRDDLYRFMDTVEQGEGSTPAAMEVGYGITDAWDDLVGAIQKIAPTTVEGVNQRVTKLSTTFDLETSMIYVMIEEKQDDYALQRARVGTQQEEIRELRAADRKLQAQFIQALTALKSCQTQLTAALGHIQILEGFYGRFYG
nr:hypothetical protein [Tanacetum cinerariifolium]